MGEYTIGQSIRPHGDMAGLPTGYYPLPGGYSYARLRVGMAVRNPAGRDIYVQPGDDEAAMWANITALDECDDPNLAAHLAHVSLSDYFD